MKRTLAIVAGLAILATGALAQTNVVLSRNAVGYVRIDLLATNKLHLIRHDFNGLSSSVAISNVLSSMPAGTTVFLWDPINQVYLSGISRSANPIIGWGSGGSNLLTRGRAFFLRTPNAATNVSSFPLYLMGEVPDRITAPTTTLSVAAGLTLLGYPYPAHVLWTNTPLAQILAPGSQIIIWNASNQSYNSAIGKSSNPFLGWGVQGNSLQIFPGMGFVIRSSNSVAYIQPKPYTWP